MNTFIKYLIVLSIVTFMITSAGCDERITNFGYDGQISGMILDQNGNPVSGDITTSSFTVFALGEEDREPMQMRVQGDGSFANLHLFPQSYTVWVEGPVNAPDEQIVDLTGAPIEHNITVTPYLTIPTPTNPSLSDSELTVNYEITESTGYIVEEKLIFVSTVSDPSSTTGNGPYWKTRQQSLDGNSGSVTISLDSELLNDAVDASGNLHIRIAARAEGTAHWNHSEQLIVEVL